MLFVSTPLVFSELYNGFVSAVNIPEPTADVTVGDKMGCKLLEENIPEGVNHTCSPFWSYDKESFMSVVKKVSVDEDENRHIVVEFKNKKMQKYLPYPFEEMQELLYINGVLVGAPANGRTLFPADQF